MRITFTDTVGIVEDYQPIPAVKQLPRWYKDTPSKFRDVRDIDDNSTPHTVKKCVPVLDAITAGYIIVTHVDILIIQKDGLPYYRWADHGAITWHPIEQAGPMPGVKSAPVPKFMNPWAIKTDPGTSVLIVNPLHRDESPITVLPGVVDTDTYHAAINFPFILNDWSYEGTIPAGTPIAQVIPFRRESWKMTIGGEKERLNAVQSHSRLRSIMMNSYRVKFWNRKRYE